MKLENFELSDNENIAEQNLWDAAEAMLKNLQTQMPILEKTSQVNDRNFYLNTLGKKKCRFRP